MGAKQSFLLIVMMLGLTGPLAAQFRVLPPAPAVVPRGSFHPRPGRVVVSGFVPSGYYSRHHHGFFAPWGFSYGIVEPRFHVEIFAPVYAAPLPPRLLPPAIDLSGIDLDVERPPWARDDELPRRGVPAVAPAEVLPPPAKPKEVAKIEPPKKEMQPPPPMPPQLPPKRDLPPTGRELSALGVAAFREGDYGLAARRFQQALEADDGATRPYFLLGNAYLALGKFREAVQNIGLGLAKDPTWPRSDFRPRLDLYIDQPADWTRHLAQLEAAQAAQPNHAGYLFLLAYARWFDDDRATATRLFREVRPLVADPALVDLFLK